MKKVTIHRGLSELKLIDNKINKSINDLDPIGVYQKDKLVNNYVKKEDFESSAKSSFQSITDLIEQKGKIKAAIVKANAETTLKVGNVEMTIAEAINAKESIKFKRDLIEHLIGRLNNVIGYFNKNNETVNLNVQKLLETVLGKDNVKAGGSDVESISAPYMAINQFHLCDPLSLKNKINSLQAEVSEFESEVDSALSEINAVTFIEY